MVILAALPGIVRELLATGRIVNPGNFGATVNFMGLQLRKVGLAFRTPMPLRRASGVAFRGIPERATENPKPHKPYPATSAIATPPACRRTSASPSAGTTTSPGPLADPHDHSPH